VWFNYHLHLKFAFINFKIISITSALDFVSWLKFCISWSFFIMQILNLINIISVSFPLLNIRVIFCCTCNNRKITAKSEEHFYGKINNCSFSLPSSTRLKNFCERRQGGERVHRYLYVFLDVSRGPATQIHDNNEASSHASQIPATRAFLLGN